MLDSPRLTFAVRRDPLAVEDLRSTTVADDPVQRRDLILLERARDGDLDAFNDLVVCYQDQLFALIVRMVPDRDQASDCVQEAFFSAFRNLAASAVAASSPGSTGSRSTRRWTSSARGSAGLSQPYPELEDESWQPPAGEEADPVTTALTTERHKALNAALSDDHRRSACGDRPVRRRGLRLCEIADMTGVSLGTVKSRIHRGRLALRDRLADRMDLFRG